MIARKLLLVALALAFGAACSDYTVHQPPPPPPADPPGTTIDAQGEPPADWDTCGSGHYGIYFNLSTDDPDVGEPVAVDTGPPPPDPKDPAAVDFWHDDHLAFSRYDPSLEFGPNWWPVDDGLADDPRYFAVQWTSWLRVYHRTTVQIVLGAATDVWIDIGQDTPIALSDVAFVPDTYGVDLQPGVYPVKIRYAQRKGQDGGFRFRVLNAADEAKICWPDFPPPADTDP